MKKISSILKKITLPIFCGFGFLLASCSGTGLLGDQNPFSPEKDGQSSPPGDGSTLGVDKPPVDTIDIPVNIAKLENRGLYIDPTSLWVETNSQSQVSHVQGSIASSDETATVGLVDVVTGQVLAQTQTQDGFFELVVDSDYSEETYLVSAEANQDLTQAPLSLPFRLYPNLTADSTDLAPIEISNPLLLNYLRKNSEEHNLVANTNGNSFLWDSFIAHHSGLFVLDSGFFNESLIYDLRDSVWQFFAPTGLDEGVEWVQINETLPSGALNLWGVADQNQIINYNLSDSNLDFFDAFNLSESELFAFVISPNQDYLIKTTDIVVSGEGDLPTFFRVYFEVIDLATGTQVSEFNLNLFELSQISRIEITWNQDQLWFWFYDQELKKTQVQLHFAESVLNQQAELNSSYDQDFEYNLSQIVFIDDDGSRAFGLCQREQQPTGLCVVDLSNRLIIHLYDGQPQEDIVAFRVLDSGDAFGDFPVVILEKLNLVENMIHELTALVMDESFVMYFPVELGQGRLPQLFLSRFGEVFVGFLADDFQGVEQLQILSLEFLDEIIDELAGQGFPVASHFDLPAK